MAVYSRQEALSTTAEALFTVAQIRRANVSNPIRVSVRNDDASIAVFIGGADVTTANGLEILAGVTFSFEIRSIDELPYVVAASGTPTIHIFVLGPFDAS